MDLTMFLLNFPLNLVLIVHYNYINSLNCPQPTFNADLAIDCLYLDIVD